MTVLSTLTDTVLVTSQDGGDKKRKLGILAIVLVGVILLLQWRGGDSEESADENEDEKESEAEYEESTDENEDETEEEGTEAKGSAKEELAEVRRELDVFDMLAILAAAIKAARNEYDQRANA